MVGLFDMDSYSGLLDEKAQKAAQARALVTMGAGLLQGAGPSLTPTSLGSNIGRAVPGALNAYDQSAQTAVRNKIIKQKLVDQAVARQAAAKQAQARKALANQLLYGTGTQGGRNMMSAGAMPRGPAPNKNQMAAGLIGAGEMGGAVDLLTQTPPDMTEKQREINSLMAQNYSRQEAEDIAYGRVRVSAHPVSGEPTLVNIRTGFAQRPEFAQSGTTAEPPSQQPGGGTLWDLANRGGRTGLLPALGDVAESTLGQLPGVDFMPGEVMQDRQTFLTEKNSLIRALSINPRFPVGEIARLEREINITPSAFTSGDQLKNRMVSVSRSLNRRLEVERRAASNADLPKETRQAAATAAKDIEGFLEVMGVPNQTQQEFPITLTPISRGPDFQSAPIDSVRSFVEDTPTEALDAMPAEIRDIILRRLRGE